MRLHNPFSLLVGCRMLHWGARCQGVVYLAGHGMETNSYRTLVGRVTKEIEISRSKFIALASPAANQEAAMDFLKEVSDPSATHNCWAYQVGDQYRSSDDGEPGGTAGRPILASIATSGLDRVVVVVTRRFGGIKLGTGGLVRAYGGIALSCLKDAAAVLVKPKVPLMLQVPFDLLGTIYPLLKAFDAEKVHEDYENGGDGGVYIKIIVEADRVEKMQQAINDASRGRACLIR